MRVLMVASSYPKFPGDVTAPFIESIAHAVAQRGHTVDMLLPHHPDLDRPTGEVVRILTYRYAPRDDWSLWGYAQSLKADVRVRKGVYLLAPLVALSLRASVSRLLRETRYDVFHAHWVVPNAALVTDIVRTHQTPLVISLHGSDVFLAERRPLVGRMAKSALALAGAITACSGDLHERALLLGADPVRTRTVPYGVDIVGFSPDRSPGDIKQRWGVPPEAFLVVAVGRLVEKKGFAHLIDAAARVPGILVVIAGEGDLRPSLEARARAANAPVVFVGPLDRDDVSRAWAAADAVAVPSVVDQAGNVDGLPNTLLEALASGRAVVASQVAGIPDVVKDDVNGLLVPPKNGEALAQALGRLAREPQTRRRLGYEARRTAVDRLSWNTAARAFEECYAQAAALDAG